MSGRFSLIRFVMLSLILSVLGCGGHDALGASPVLAASSANGLQEELPASPSVEANVVVQPFAQAPLPQLAAAAGSTDLVYSTFVGGTGDDQGQAVAVDNAGAAYAAGSTTSCSFPTGKNYCDENGDFQGAFVVKINPGGTGLAYIKFFAWLSVADIAVDGSGSVYLTGVAGPELPTTPGAYDRTYNEGGDAFVLKLNATGELVYGTYLGGSENDAGTAIAVDSSGAVYVTGETPSPNFPTTTGAFARTFKGCFDTFVTKLDAAGSKLVYSTFAGGKECDYATDIAVDKNGQAFVTGYTWSTDFPTTPGAFDTTHNGHNDAFVAKLNPQGGALVYSTFVGKDDVDVAAGLALDAGGAAYVVGSTASVDFPTTPGAFDRTLGGFSDAFVFKLNPQGSALAYSTLLGGGDHDCYNIRGCDIAVDGSGVAYVVGNTFSTNFPTTPGAYDRTFNGGTADAFVAKLNPQGAALSYATFFGGKDDDCYLLGCALAVDKDGSAYVVGYTSSANFPTTAGAFDTSYNGYGDAFVAKFFGSAPLQYKFRVYVPLLARAR